MSKHNLSFDYDLEFIFDGEDLSTPVANSLNGTDATSLSNALVGQLNRGYVKLPREVTPVTSEDGLRQGYGVGIRFAWNDLPSGTTASASDATISNSSPVQYTTNQVTSLFGDKNANGETITPSDLIALPAFSVKVDKQYVAATGITEFGLILSDRTVWKITWDGSSAAYEPVGFAPTGRDEARLRLLGNI